jgi:MoxR-like ATPase
MSGTGKTEFFRYMAWLMRLPFERFPINNSSELDDLEGKMTFVNQETKFQPGRFTEAWIRPCVLDLDEWNTGPEDVQQFFRPLMDNSKSLILDAWDGREYGRGDNTFFGMAMNQSWDIRNIGAKEIGDADARRLHHVEMELPPDEIEREIIKRHVMSSDGYEVSKDHLDLIIAVSRDLRELSDNATIPISWGIAPNIKVARLLKYFNPQRAYGIAAGNFIEPAARERFVDAISTHIE